MPKSVILSTARTPIGKLGGGLASLDAVALGTTASPAALTRAGIAPEEVEHAVMARCSRPARARSRPARRRSARASPLDADTIKKVCLRHARGRAPRRRVRAWDLAAAVAGRMESMSSAPYLLPGPRFGYRMGDAAALDAIVHDGLMNPFSGRQMLDEATEVGDRLELTRPELDRWALRSHDRAPSA